MYVGGAGLEGSLISEGKAGGIYGDKTERWKRMNAGYAHHSRPRGSTCAWEDSERLCTAGINLYYGMTAADISFVI